MKLAHICHGTHSCVVAECGVQVVESDVHLQILTAITILFLCFCLHDSDCIHLT